MLCPRCRGETKVTDSRPTADDDGVRRRRQCLVCYAKYTTKEFIVIPKRPMEVESWLFMKPLPYRGKVT